MSDGSQDMSEQAGPGAADGLDEKNSLESRTSNSVTTLQTLQAATRLRAFAPWAAAYVVVSYLTGAYFMADTVDYVGDVYNYQLGVSHRLWEFAHLFWRPLGWVLFLPCQGLFQSAAGYEPKIFLARIFVSLNWIAGLVCVFLLRAILRRFSISPPVVACTITALLFSNAFLNYIHSGTSYIPGLAFLLAGFYLLSIRCEELDLVLRPLWAAGALAISVCLWFPYIFAVPGTLAIPLFRCPRNPRRWAVTLKVTLFTLILGLVFYGSALACNGILTPHAVSQWVTAESRAVGGVGGPTRAIFGFARSFIYMGNDGVLFKRFLLRDPYNAVSLFDLLRISLFKLILFYCLLFFALKQLIADSRVVWICLITAVPVLSFALLWHGGDIERYLPLYPIFFIGVALVVDDNRTPVYFKWLAASLLLVSLVSNFGATSALVLNREQRRTEERIQGVLPLLKPGSRLVLVDIHDELENFMRSFPFNNLVSGRVLRTYPVLNPGTVQTFHWRQDLKAVVLNAWKTDSQIWVSKRILEPRPHRDWKWVEGGDPRVTWSTVHTFFLQFDYGRSVGSEDGFVLLPSTAKNKAIIESLQDDDQSAEIQRHLQSADSRTSYM